MDEALCTTGRSKEVSACARNEEPAFFTEQQGAKSKVYSVMRGVTYDSQLSQNEPVGFLPSSNKPKSEFLRAT